MLHSASSDVGFTQFARVVFMKHTDINVSFEKFLSDFCMLIKIKIKHEPWDLFSISFATALSSLLLSTPEVLQPSTLPQTAYLHTMYGKTGACIQYPVAYATFEMLSFLMLYQNLLFVKLSVTVPTVVLRTLRGKKTGLWTVKLNCSKTV